MEASVARGPWRYHVSILSKQRAFVPRALTLFVAVLLFLLNAYVCRRLFGVEYLRDMGSIEAAYIGLSRYLLAHWRDFSWFPLWYAGIPAQNTYPPLLHWFVALVALLRGISTAHAYHWATALFYCFGPVALFALTLRLSGSLRAAFIAGALYSTLSPSAWLMPEIGRDTGIFHPERLSALVHYGEGPHVASLTLLPLAILFLDLALKRRRAIYFALAALSFASVALTNWIGAFALALGVIAYLLAKPIPSKRFAHDLALTVFVAIAAYCLAFPWIPPSTIAAVDANSKLVGRRLYAHRRRVAALGSRHSARHTDPQIHPSPRPGVYPIRRLLRIFHRASAAGDHVGQGRAGSPARALSPGDGASLSIARRVAFRRCHPPPAGTGRSPCHRRAAARVGLAAEIGPRLRARRAHTDHRYSNHLGMAHGTVAESALERRPCPASRLLRLLADGILRCPASRRRLRSRRDHPGLFRSEIPDRYRRISRIVCSRNRNSLAQGSGRSRRGR